MIFPFKMCECGATMASFKELTWDHTKPDPITRVVEIAFICPTCARLEYVSFATPVFSRHVTRNLMRSINKTVKVNTWGLLGTITLNTPDPGEHFYGQITDGMQYALAQLSDMGLVYSIDWVTFSFRLTIHGWIALLHSAY